PAVEGVPVTLGAVQPQAEEGVGYLLGHYLRGAVVRLGPERVKRLALMVAQVPASAIFHARLLLGDPAHVLVEAAALAGGRHEDVADDLVVWLVAFDADAQPVPPAVGQLPVEEAEVPVVVARQVGELRRPPLGVLGPAK